MATRKRKTEVSSNVTRRKVTKMIRHTEDDQNSLGTSSDTRRLVNHVHLNYSTSTNASGMSVQTWTIPTLASPTKQQDTFVPTFESQPMDHNINHTFLDPSDPQEDGTDTHYQWQCHERADDNGKGRKKYHSDFPLREWLPYRQEWLDELVRLEGRANGIHQTRCAGCAAASPRFRCRICYGADLWCQSCIVLSHKRNPLHFIEEWDKGQFTRTTLKSLGLCVSLHGGITHCLQPTAPKHLVVIDVDSIQEVTVFYCGCQNAPKHVTQLLQARWFPATVSRPSTVATFRVLEHFHVSSFQSKMSVFDFYHTIERRTDNTGLRVPPDRYREFLRMDRMWRHLKLLKRAGRAQQINGVEMMQGGDCALSCPACPQPEVNLPPDWKSRPEQEQWLFSLIVALDANFRLRRRNISNNTVDPPLGSGRAYFVEHDAYQLYLNQRVHEPEISTCSNHTAIGKAHLKRDQRLATTGVGACICARHGLIRARGVGDLQRGERYSNMDYIFLSALQGDKSRRLVISYDICCQWYKNLRERMSKMPAQIHLDLSEVLIRYVIPKFHLPAHVPGCHAPFSLNFAEGVGRTDGEGIERDWSMINPISYSTREMGPGHRADILDDHWGDWNWRKISGMGRALARKFRAAIPELIKHADAFRVMCDSLPGAQITEWVEMVETWEKQSSLREPHDVTAENPYEYTVTGITLAQVCLQLAEEHAAGDITMNDCSPSQFLITGLELEEVQVRLRDDRAHLLGGTVPQRTALQERRNFLAHKLDVWEAVQIVYMPGVAQLRTDWNLGLGRLTKPPRFAGEPEERKLFLPSEVPLKACISSRLAELRAIEARLREGQAHDALQQVRHYLRLLSFSHKHKRSHCRGQKENTRAGTLIKRAEAKRRFWVARYRAARCALQAVDPGGSWSSTLAVLKEEDIRGLADPVGTESEGKRVLSWIWMIPSVCSATEADDPGLHDSLRVEFCKSRARFRRWREEIQLLQEEMRRVQQWLAWRAQWWEAQMGARVVDSLELREGLFAYCIRQAHLCLEMRRKFLEVWDGAKILLDTEMACWEGSKKID